MRYSLKQIAAPSGEPVSSDEALDWLRQSDTTESAKVGRLITTARDMVERSVGVQMMTATYRYEQDWIEGFTIRLPRPPLQSVSSIQYRDIDGVIQDLDTDIYEVDTESDPGRVTLAPYKIWPVILYGPGAFRITYTAGYGGASAVPGLLKTAVLMLVAYLYEHPGDDGARDELPAAVTRILNLTDNGVQEYGE